MAEGVSLDDPNLEDKLTKSDQLAKIDFEASVTRGVQSVFKADDEFVIWGPASVEIVDKEGDKIKADALDNALPQLLKRARLSLEHSDQIVGRILERFETEDPVTVEINGQTYERSEFPTDVLDLDDGQPPALYVAGEVFSDSQQSKRARERIQDGELDSYSISGEALVTRKKVEDGIVYDDIVDMDLSAVTLCEEGMNQGAKYARVDAEVSDKELAGEASGDVSKREEIPVLEHPSMSGVTPSESTSSGTSQRQTAKSMSDNPEDGEEKSEGDDGPGIEDVLKRLPEEGELATKDDLDEVQEKAVESVQESLPDGDLATISAMESLVDEKVDEKYDPPQGEAGVDDDHGGGVSGQATDGDGENYGSDGPDDSDTTGPDAGTNNDASPDSEGGSDTSTTSDKSAAEKLAEEYDMEPSEVEAAVEASAKGDVPPEFEDGGDDEDDDDDEDDEKSDDSEESQSVEEKADSVRDARDKLANELGVDKDEVNTALATLLEAGEDDPDGDGEEETVDEDDVEDPDGDGEDEVEVVEDEEEDEPEEPEMDEESDEGDEEGESYERLLERLEEDLPADVWEVVREYVKADVDESETFESPAEILRGSESSDGEEGDVNKAVQEVLEGGAEVQGGKAIPTDPDEDQVDKQYSPAEDEEGSGESPALQNFYG